MPKKTHPSENQGGAVLYRLDPIVMKWHYEIDYIHSYAQDSPFFAALAEGRLLGSACGPCGYRYATPRASCMQCGAKTAWVELPSEGKIHTFTTCYFGGEAFLKETPFTLILVEFKGFDTLFLSRFVGARRVRIGMRVRPKFRRMSTFQASDLHFVPV